VVFAASDTERPFLTHNPQLLNALLPHLQANSPSSPVSALARVRSVIAERVRGQRPMAPAIARELAMSTRAMQRLLNARGGDPSRTGRRRGALSCLLTRPTPRSSRRPGLRGRLSAVVSFANGPIEVTIGPLV
jgi:hypothetical protein